MSIFGDLDMDKVAADPWSVEDGTYEMTVEECTAGPTNKGDKRGILWKWNVDASENPQMVGRKFTEWLEIPTPADPNNLTAEEQQKASRVKARMLSLGVPEARINTVSTGEMTGVSAIVRIATTSKNGTDFQNIRDIKLKGAEAPASAAGNPFAALANDTAQTTENLGI